MSTSIELKRNLILLGMVVIIIVLGLGVWSIPRSSVLNTVQKVEVSTPIYRGQTGTTDQFYIEYDFNNPGWTTVDITGLESKILLNGSDYNSIQVSHDLTSIEPGSTGEVIRVVQQSNAPISFTEGKVWNVTLVTEISAEASLSFFQYSETVTEVNSYSWEVNLVD
jgi:hypothetical protein